MSDFSLVRKEETELRYPFARIPERGEMMEVAPGIYWVRFPLPFVLTHINLWLLEEEDGWTLIDTGISDDVSRQLWREIFKTGLKGKPMNRVICTHLHADHMGLAGWLTREWDIDLYASRTDFDRCRILALDIGREPPEKAIKFYRATGMDEDVLDAYKRRFGSFGERVSRMPDTYRRLREGDELTIAGRTFRVVIGRGHAPEHVCLYSEEAGLLFSGDQVLPRISSNVSVQPTEAYENPLGDWLESCHRIRATLSDDVLVLPAHNEPFYGLHQRMTQLIDGHAEGLDKLRDMLKQPRRAVEVFPALFKRDIGPDLVFIATGETLAHLNYLIAAGEASVEADAQGINWYRSI